MTKPNKPYDTTPQGAIKPGSVGALFPGNLALVTGNFRNNPRAIVAVHTNGSSNQANISS